MVVPMWFAILCVILALIILIGQLNIVHKTYIQVKQEPDSRNPARHFTAVVQYDAWKKPYIKDPDYPGNMMIKPDGKAFQLNKEYKWVHYTGPKVRFEDGC